MSQPVRAGSRGASEPADAEESGGESHDAGRRVAGENADRELHMAAIVRNR